MTVGFDVPAHGYLATKKALLVGIGYDNDADESGRQTTPIPTSIPNIRMFEDFIRKDWGYTDIIVMTDEDGVEEGLQPTRRNLEYQMNALTHGVKPGDRRVFYFAGHTEQMPCKTGSEEDDQDEVLVALGGNTIRDNYLNKWLVEPLPAGSALTAVFDSCNSGTLLDLQHYKCNGVYYPWVNKGKRRTNTLQNCVVRRNGEDARPGSQSLSRMGSGDQFPGLTQTMETHQAFVFPPDEDPDKHRRRWCASPEPKFLCEGKCRDFMPKMERLPHADVISISSSSDGQFSYDAYTSKGESISMTRHFVKIIRKRPQITYQDLMTHLNHEVHSFTRGMHKQVRLERRAAYANNTNSKDAELEEKGEMDNFQNLQLGSITPLDMGRIFTL